MAVTLRLKREGAKDRPYYRIVATDSRNKRDGRPIESLGTYDPMKKSDNSNVSLERIDYWLSQGATISDTVKSLVKKARKAESASA